MRIMLVLMTFLAFGPLAADNAGQVEYQLPQGQKWKVLNQFSTDKNVISTTTTYIPESATQETAQEFFSTHVNSSHTDVNDIDSLKQGLERGLQLQFTDPKVALKTLEKDPNSALYEWSATDGGKEKIHGWIRVFSVPSASIMLGFETKQIDKVNEAGPLWLKTLKDAKIAK